MPVAQGEELVRDCQCKRICRSIVIMQTLRLGGQDFICSSAQSHIALIGRKVRRIVIQSIILVFWMVLAINSPLQAENPVIVCAKDTNGDGNVDQSEITPVRSLRKASLQHRLCQLHGYLFPATCPAGGH